MADPILQDPARGAWLRRLPHYLYFGDLCERRRVLEVGCGTGHGARFLAGRGAARVVGIDADPAAIEEARSRHRLSNLEFRCEDPASIEMEDGSFECLFVPDAVEILRRPGVLTELRRVLARGGRLIMAATSADRPAAERGASYYEFVDRLQPLFAPVRMFAQSPLVALSIVEYGAEEALPPELELDATLLQLASGEGEVTDYIAVCGGPAEPLRGFTVVQLPVAGGIDAIGRGVDSELARALERAERRAARALDQLRALEARAAVAAAGVAPAGRVEADFQHQLDLALRAQRAAEAEARDLARRLEEARREGSRTADDAGAELERAGREIESLRRRVLELDGESGQRQRGGDRGDAPSVSEQIASALAAHQEEVGALEAILDERQAYVDEALDELGQARAALEDANGRHRASEDRIAELEAEVRGLRDRAAAAEGKLLRARGAGDAAVAPALDAPGTPAGEKLVAAGVARRLLELADRLAALESATAEEVLLLGELERELVTLRADSSDAGEEAGVRSPAERDAQLRSMAGELGMKDAEITLLHVGVSSLRERVREVVTQVREVRHRMDGRSAPEMLELLDRLTERLSVYES